MSRSANRNAGASADLFALQGVPGSYGSDESSSPDKRDPEQFLNAYAEASQALSPRLRPNSITATESSCSSSVGEQCEKEARNSDRQTLKAERPAANLDGGTNRPGIASQVAGSIYTPERPLSRLMTVADVANYLRVSISAVWRLIKKDPAFPRPFSVGGSTRWHRQQLDRYVDDLAAVGDANR